MIERNTVPAAETDTVSVTVADPIASVSFKRPEKRNCMSPALNRQMMRVLDTLEFRAEWGLVNEAVPLDELRAKVEDVAAMLLKKNGATLTAIKGAMRRVGEMTFDNAEDYLVTAQEALGFHDHNARKEGMRKFIDDKTYKPGLGEYDKSVRA